MSYRSRTNGVDIRCLNIGEECVCQLVYSFSRSLIHFIKSLLIPTEHCLPLLWRFGTITKEASMGAIWLDVTGDFSSLNVSHLFDLNRRES